LGEPDSSNALGGFSSETKGIKTVFYGIGLSVFTQQVNSQFELKGYLDVYVYLKNVYRDRHFREIPTTIGKIQKN